MNISELNQNELEELREAYFNQLFDTDPEILGDITNANEISMESIMEHYEGINFVEEDFFCNI